MDNAGYDIERLQISGEIDVEAALKNFESEQGFFDSLAAFAQSPKKSLLTFSPYKISNKTESRKEFLKELKSLRETLVSLGIEDAASDLSGLESASFAKNEKLLERELSDFRVRMDKISRYIAAAYKPAPEISEPEPAPPDDVANQASPSSPDNTAAPVPDVKATAPASVAPFPAVGAAPAPADKPTLQETALDEHEKHIILAVDDMKPLLSSVVSMLLDQYVVMAVTSGVSALKVLEKHSPSLFLLDIEMPQMDGYELAAAIRADERFKDTPIIFLTAKANREAVVAAIQHGGNDYIVKPVEKELLLEKIQRFLR